MRPLQAVLSLRLSVRIGIPLLAILALLALHTQVAQAAIIPVTTTKDIVDSADEFISLREAIITANGTVAADTITLPAGVYQLVR